MLPTPSAVGDILFYVYDISETFVSSDDCELICDTALFLYLRDLASGKRPTILGAPMTFNNNDNLQS